MLLYSVAVEVWTPVVLFGVLPFIVKRYLNLRYKIDGRGVVNPCQEVSLSDLASQ